MPLHPVISPVSPLCCPIISPFIIIYTMWYKYHHMRPTYKIVKKTHGDIMGVYHLPEASVINWVSSDPLKRSCFGPQCSAQTRTYTRTPRSSGLRELATQQHIIATFSTGPSCNLTGGNPTCLFFGGEGKNTMKHGEIDCTKRNTSKSCWICHCQVCCNKDIFGGPCIWRTWMFSKGDSWDNKGFNQRFKLGISFNRWSFHC